MGQGNLNPFKGREFEVMSLYMAEPRLEARAYSKARKYMNTENLDFPASLARFPNLANANVYRR